MSPSAADDPTNPLNLFQKITVIERIQAEHSLQMAHSNQNLVTAMQGLQVDVARLVSIGERQVELQHAATETSSGLERLAASFEALSLDLKERWREHLEVHDRRDALHAVTAERVTMFRGALVAMTLLGGLLTTLAGVYFNSQLADIHGAISAASAQYQQDRDRLDRRMDRLDVLFRESQLK